MPELTMCPNKAGKGFKVVVDGVWFYTSVKEFDKMVNGKAYACKFRTTDEWKHYRGDTHGII